MWVGGGGQVRCVGTCLLTPHRWGPGEALGHGGAFSCQVWWEELGAENF